MKRSTFQVGQKVWNCCMHNKCMRSYRNLTMCPSGLLRIIIPVLQEKIFFGLFLATFTSLTCCVSVNCFNFCICLFKFQVLGNIKFVHGYFYHTAIHFMTLNWANLRKTSWINFMSRRIFVLNIVYWTHNFVKSLSSDSNRIFCFAKYLLSFSLRWSNYFSIFLFFFSSRKGKISGWAHTFIIINFAQSKIALYCSYMLKLF